MSARAWVWRHPEWWALALSAVAWVLLARMTSGHASGAAAHAMPAGMAMDMDMGHEAGAHWTLWMFAVMVVAMMVPGTIGSIRATAASSLWRRRGRAVAEHLGGFVGVWVAAGAAILAARSLLGIGEPGGLAAAIAFAAAAAWQLTPVKRRALNAHHRTRPLAPSGLRADRDCVAYGAAVGSRCVVSCGPLMVATTLAVHALVAMAGATALILAERYRFRAPRRTSAAAIGALAVLAVTW